MRWVYEVGVYHVMRCLSVMCGLLPMLQGAQGGEGTTEYSRGLPLPHSVSHPLCMYGLVWACVC